MVLRQGLGGEHEFALGNRAVLLCIERINDDGPVGLDWLRYAVGIQKDASAKAADRPLALSVQSRIRPNGQNTIGHELLLVIIFPWPGSVQRQWCSASTHR